MAAVVAAGAVSALTSVAIAEAHPYTIHCPNSSGGKTGYPAERLVVTPGNSDWEFNACVNGDALSEEVGAGVISPTQIAGPETTSSRPREFRFVDNNRVTIWRCWVREGPSSPYVVHVDGASETAPDGWWNWSCTGSNTAVVAWRGTMDVPRP